MSTPIKKKRRLDVGFAAVASPAVSSSPFERVYLDVDSSPHLKRKNDKDGGDDVVLSCMMADELRSDDPEIVRASMSAVSTMVENSPDFRSRALHHHGAQFSVVNAMKRHATDNRIQYFGCWALSFLCTGSDNSHDEGIQVGLAAMRTFRKDASIQASASTYLGSIGLFANAAACLIQRGGLEDVFQAMKDHPQDGIVQRRACFTLKNVLSTQPLLFPGLCAEAIELIIRAMDKYSSDGLLASHACYVLCHLVWHSNLERRNDYRRTIVNANGMGSIANVFRQFPNNHNLVSLASETMRAFLNPTVASSCDTLKSAIW